MVCTAIHLGGVNTLVGKKATLFKISFKWGVYAHLQHSNVTNDNSLSLKLL